MVDRSDSSRTSRHFRKVPLRKLGLARHGATAIAQAAQNARACESKGDAEQAKEWRHIEDAIKIMRGPHQS